MTPTYLYYLLYLLCPTLSYIFYVPRSTISSTTMSHNSCSGPSSVCCILHTSLSRRASMAFLDSYFRDMHEFITSLFHVCSVMCNMVDLSVIIPAFKNAATIVGSRIKRKQRVDAWKHQKLPHSAPMVPIKTAAHPPHQMNSHGDRVVLSCNVAMLWNRKTHTKSIQPPRSQLCASQAIQGHTWCPQGPTW